MTPERRAEWREYVVRDVYALEDDEGNPRDPTPQEERYIEAHTDYVIGSHNQHTDTRDLIRRIVDLSDELAALRAAPDALLVAAVTKIVAMSPLAFGHDEVWCPFCGASLDYHPSERDVDRFRHTDDCAWVALRAALRGEGGTDANP